MEPKTPRRDQPRSLRTAPWYARGLTPFARD
jgi:hypothetical protein